jgi:hypothetical protein
MKQLATILCILLALLFSPPAKAWSGAGHQVIAAEAYRQLSPDLQKKVTEILKAHPDYAKWKESFTSESPNLDLPAFIFIRSSTWPDEIRRRGNQYDHPHWHYIDYPLKPPNSRLSLVLIPPMTFFMGSNRVKRPSQTPKQPQKSVPCICRT